MNPVLGSGKATGPRCLRDSLVFCGLSDVVLEEIGRMMTVRSAAKHEIIWLEQESARMVYFLESGLVKLFKTSPSGKEQILRLVRPGDCFGHAGAFNGGHHPESAQALSPSVLYGISQEDLKGLLVKHPALSHNIIRLLATEMHHYITLVEDLSLRCVSGRLARMLLTDSHRQNPEAPQALTRSDMAAMAGTVREVVGKSLKVLESRGAIRYDRRRIIVQDREALKSIMHSN